jgi:hypothetical protein
MKAKLSTYTSKSGRRCESACTFEEIGVLSSNAMIVMITAKTPSLNDSSRPVPMTALAELFVSSLNVVSISNGSLVRDQKFDA